MIPRPLEPGSFVRFTYRADKTDDPYKEILILHPNWQGKVHGIDLRRLTPAQVEVVSAIMDPATRSKPHRLPLVNDVVRRMDPIKEITNPIGFYQRFVRVFLKGIDAYRTYWPSRMYAVQVIKGSQVEGKLINPAPLFKK